MYVSEGDLRRVYVSEGILRIVYVSLGDLSYWILVGIFKSITFSKVN